MFCPKCGKENSPQSRFCQNCGFDIKSVVTEPAGQPVLMASGSENAAVPPAGGAAVPPLGTPANPIAVNVYPIATPAYAGFWLRFVASIIDGLIIGAVTFPIAFIFGIADVFSENRSEPNLAMAWIPNILSMVINWLYDALMESSSRQATLGKMVIGVKVTDLNGNRISFGRATGRYFSKILSGLILGIGYLMIAFTAKKQGLHDMIAGTLVVKK